MKKFFTIGILLSLPLFGFGAGCNSIPEKPSSNIELIQPTTSTNETVTNTHTSTPPVYSVDGFVTTPFKEGEKLRIQVESITCYNNSCGFDGKKWSISLTQQESKPFLSLSGKKASFIIEAETACSKDMIPCHSIKNVHVVNQ